MERQQSGQWQEEKERSRGGWSRSITHSSRMPKDPSQMPARSLNGVHLRRKKGKGGVEPGRGTSLVGLEVTVVDEVTERS